MRLPLPSKYQFQIEPQLSRIHLDEEIPLLKARREAQLVVVVGLRFAGKTELCAKSIHGQHGVLEGLRPAVLRGVFEVLELVERDSRGALPLLVIDDIGSSDALVAMDAFFLPRPRIIVAEAQEEHRLARAVGLSGSGPSWTLDRLRRLDRVVEEKLHGILDVVGDDQRLLLRVNTENGFDGCRQDVAAFLGKR